MAKEKNETNKLLKENEKLKKQLEKQDKAIETLEKILNEKEKLIEKKEFEIQKFFQIENNRDLYSNLATIERTEFNLKQYKKMYEEEKKRNEYQLDLKGKLLNALEVVIPELRQITFDEVIKRIKKLEFKNNKSIKNDRNAGRKNIIDDYFLKVKQLINLHNNISARAISRQLGISHTSVTTILKKLKSQN